LRVDFTIEGDDEEDDGDNDGEVDKHSDNFEEELVTICVNMGDPTDFIGEEGCLSLRILSNMNVTGSRVATTTSINKTEQESNQTIEPLTCR
jgi:hypothetical protein